jgi:hypothetical protein
MEERAFDTHEEAIGFMQGVGYATAHLGRRAAVEIAATARPDGRWVVYVNWTVPQLRADG